MKHQFQTEVDKLLHLIIHSLYSHKEIFLRELVSNASDAIDKLKYLKFTDDAYKNVDFDGRIDISFSDSDGKKTLTVSDSGIGMDEIDLTENLGTIARSGTKNFIEKLTGDAKKDSNLIGQFGVGFYSSFMIADEIEVISKKAGMDKAYKWVSDGKTGFEITEDERASHGTTIILKLNENGAEYANRWQIEQLIKKYSNHIACPIFLTYESEKDGKKETVTDQINSASAFWKRSKSELKDEDYNEFYKSLSGDFEDPMLHIHTRAEGTLDYTTLFFIPKKAPFDLFRSDYAAGVKLYVKRVFITDDEKELMPVYLRFVKGVIDSEDLPLNVSREILQQNKVMAKIRSNSVKKILSEFETLSKDKEKYADFYKEFGKPLKEGLYQDFENRETLTELVRFKSTKREGYVSFAEYVSSMNSDQKSIYYITGGTEENLKNSPLLEYYRKKDIEVLIMDDEIDEIVIPSLFKYKDFDLKAVNRTDSADELKTEDEKKSEESAKDVIEKIKKILGDKVKDVKASSRLSDSPCCVVADSTDPSFQMQAMLKAMGQSGGDVKPVFEINPNHPIIKKLETNSDEAVLENTVNLLFVQAMMLEGGKIDNTASFAKAMNAMLEKAL
ncbi:MAG TPA: molecular chaperone HtpG [Spirochaetota bacterium]|nr:molecular chaperone HtpG [Spirochaetota bacterium]HQO23117.1 molecular chaperone HtpG [Spirochaetota bacterium]HQQ23731.1 molecular chaperone HtpG [Spirochaetota bacterium]